MKRIYFDEFASGGKTIEYRRYGRIFTERTFYAGRAVLLAYNYDISRYPTLRATVSSFDCVRAGSLNVDLTEVYRDLTADALIAVIRLSVDRPA